MADIGRTTMSIPQSLIARLSGQSAAPAALDGSTPGGDIVSQLMADPALQAALAAESGGTSPLAAEMTLPELLADSAMTVSGRKGLTGQSYTGDLPPWAADLSPEVLGHPDFDPYFGVVSQDGDERVYMRSRTVPVKGLTEDAQHEVAPSGDGVDFVSGANATEKDRPQPTGKTETQDKTLTVMQAMNLPYSWDEEEITEAMEKMKAAGFNVTSFDRGENSLLSVWGGMVQRAAMIYSTSEGERKVTPWDALDLYKSEAKAAGILGEADGNFTRSTVQRSVSDITEGEAWSVLQSNLSRMLGRDPSDQEVRDFTYKMNQLAAANPSISKTITRYKNGSPVSSNTHTSAGFSGEDVAMEAYEDAQSDPEYAEYQGATTYFQAALSALGAIGQT